MLLDGPFHLKLGVQDNPHSERVFALRANYIEVQLSNNEPEGGRDISVEVSVSALGVGKKEIAEKEGRARYIQNGQVPFHLDIVLQQGRQGVVLHVRKENDLKATKLRNQGQSIADSLMYLLSYNQIEE